MNNKSKILECRVEKLGISSWKSWIIDEKLGISADKPGFSGQVCNKSEILEYRVENLGL